MFVRAEANIAGILVVGDALASAQFLADMLAGDYLVRVTASGTPAMEALALSSPDLILLDVGMSEKEGFGFCRSLKTMAQYAEIPIIFVSALDDTNNKVAAFKHGCADYVTKPFAVDEIKARIRSHLKQKHQRDLLGFHAGHDTLTGLPNRNLLIDRLQKAISYGERYDQRVVVGYLDLDKFKYVNDTLGHGAGDQLLVEVAQRLLLCVRESDTVARVGGDEFVVILYHQANEDVILSVIKRILTSIAEPVAVNDGEIRITCSIGLAFFPQDGRDIDSLLKNADAAMYRAKELGGNNSQFFTDELNIRITERAVLEKSLRGALERGEFLLHYQPRVDLRSGKIVGLEALIRWNHPELGVVLPTRFIPLAEEVGLMHQIGIWVMRTACRQQKIWQLGNVATLPIAINISGVQFLQKDFIDIVKMVLGETEVSPACLELEISESVLMQDPESTIRVLRELRVVGVRLVVDDFGTGYTNLSFLKHFSLDNIKLHQSFVHNIERNPEDLAISDAVISMAHSLRLRVIAEGVESASQLALLADHGCDEMQGHYFSAAISRESCTGLLQENHGFPIEKLGRHHNSRTLLLVDDEPNVLTALGRTLHGQGYHVLTADSAASAFGLLATHEVGVIVCDQRMPGMTGIALFSRVRYMYPHTVRIILSGYADVNMVTDAINLGAVYKFLSKPWDQIELRNIIEMAFEKYGNDLEMEVAGSH